MRKPSSLKLQALSTGCFEIKGLDMWKISKLIKKSDWRSNYNPQMRCAMFACCEMEGSCLPKYFPHCIFSANSCALIMHAYYFFCGMHWHNLGLLQIFTLQPLVSLQKCCLNQVLNMKLSKDSRKTSHPFFNTLEQTSCRLLSQINFLNQQILFHMKFK